MSDDKPVRVPAEHYPDVIYPKVVTPITTSENKDDSEIHLLDYWRIIVARRWTIYAITTTIVLVTMIATFKQTPVYRAMTSIQIDRENQNILTFKDVYEIQTQTDDMLQTQYKVLSSRSLARRVIEELRLNQVDEFADKDGFFGSYVKTIQNVFGPPVSKTDEPDALRRVIDKYLDRLQVSPVRQARLVNVSFESKDPALAARIINTHGMQFIEQNLQYKYDATQDASEFLSQRLQGLRQTLEKSEDKLQQYSQQSHILFTEEGKNTATEKLSQLQEEFTRVQADRFQKESLDRIVRAGGADVVPQLTNNQLISALATRVTELQREESELAVTFGPEWPNRKRIRGQIEEVQKTLETEKDKIVQGIESEYKAALEREKLLAQALENQQKEVNRINQEIIQYNILKREAESNRQLHDGLLTRLKEAGISAGLRASNVRVVDRAEIPEKPIRPSKPLNLVLSLIGGLACGIGLAFFQEYMDNSIKSSDDVTRFLKIPTLGMVPKLESLGGAKKYGYGYSHSNSLTKSDAADRTIELIVHGSPDSLMAEAYRSVRTSLLLSSPDHPPRSLIVTSAVPSEGKTVTAINTAVSLTQTGSRVVLIDADMRKPRLHNVFSLNGGFGLSSFLSGAATLKDVIHPTVVPNLFVIPCGVLPPNPAELILSSRLRRMVEALNGYFDFVILDSPPLVNVSDARILSSTCDASLLVVKAFATSRYVVKRAVDDLRSSTARLIGTVLNDVDVRTGAGYYPYYSTRYSYHNGYDSYSPTAEREEGKRS